jgi:hypothetical protein
MAAVAAAVMVLASCGFGATLSADQITDQRARLVGRVSNVDPGVTSYHFEYGTTPAYGSSTPVGTANVTDIASPWTVANTITGLDPGTVYHYRVCAEDVDGHGTCGEDTTFTTHTGHDSIVGYGTVLNPSPHGGPYPAYTIDAQIDAVADIDGSAPTGSAQRSVPVPTGTVFYARGDVTCVRVEGNRATVGFFGVIDGLGFGAATVFFVEDGASTGTPDRFATKAVDQVPTTCPAPVEADFPAPVPGGNVLLSGDFAVHDGS